MGSISKYLLIELPFFFSCLGIFVSACRQQLSGQPSWLMNCGVHALIYCDVWQFIYEKRRYKYFNRLTCNATCLMHVISGQCLSDVFLLYIFLNRFRRFLWFCKHSALNLLEYVWETLNVNGSVLCSSSVKTQ